MRKRAISKIEVKYVWRSQIRGQAKVWGQAKIWGLANFEAKVRPGQLLGQARPMRPRHTRPGFRVCLSNEGVVLDYNFPLHDHFRCGNCCVVNVHLTFFLKQMNFVPAFELHYLRVLIDRWIDLPEKKYPDFESVFFSRYICIFIRKDIPGNKHVYS